MSRFSWLPYMRSRSSDLGQSQQVTQEPIQQVLDNASSSETENQPMDFDSIADRVEQLQEELFYAQDLCEQADLQISKYRTDIHELKYTIATLEHAIVGLRTNEAKNALAQARHEKKEVKRAVTAMKSLQARCDTQTVMMKAMGKHAQDSEQKYKELKFDFELYKCTMNPGLDCLHTADPNSPLPAQPFVVVLVDGDAYQVRANVCESYASANNVDLVVSGFHYQQPNPNTRTNASFDRHRWCWRSCCFTSQE
jgi:myosin heavy subunit